jgi:apolipoprotein N-acyltransferase
LASLSGWRADLAALGLGALAAAALPPVCAIPVLLVATPGLLALIDGAAGPRTAARRGWWFGFGHNLLGLYWITEAILVEAARFWWLVPLAVPLLAAVMAVFIAVPAGLARLARPGWPRVFALAGGWVLADLARQFIATGFPWNPWGSVWEMPGLAGDVMLQPAAWIGAPGLTFLTVGLSALPALGWRWRAGGAVVVAAWVAVGFARLQAPLPPSPGLKVVLVQGNVAEGQKWSRALAEDIFQRYLGLTREGIAQVGNGAAVVVWPETASPYLLQTDTAARAAIAAAAGNAPTLVGAVRFDQADRPRNSLFAMLPNGAVAGVYDKWHLVPFGEYQPSWFPLPIQVVPGGGFQFGPGPRTLHVPNLPAVGPLICYEAIFPGQVVDAADRPAWMVNITNDAWFGNSTGPRQHLAGARLRAVEEGLPLLRAANTGISVAFDPRGHELARLGMNQAGMLIVDLPPALPPSLFARLGLLVPALMGFAALGLGMTVPGGAVVSSRRPKKKTQGGNIS